eukprot:gene6561-13270_t
MSDLRLLIKNAPKVELHVHLDGAFDLDLLWNAAKIAIDNDELPESSEAPWSGSPLYIKGPLTNAIQSGKSQFHNLLTTQMNEVISNQLETMTLGGGLNRMLDCFGVRYSPHILTSTESWSDIRSPREAVEAVTAGIRMFEHELLQQYQQGHRITSNHITSELDSVANNITCDSNDSNKSNITNGKYSQSGSTSEPIQSTVCGDSRCYSYCYCYIRQILCCISFAPQWSEE